MLRLYVCSSRYVQGMSGESFPGFTAPRACVNLLHGIYLGGTKVGTWASWASSICYTYMDPWSFHGAPSVVLSCLGFGLQEGWLNVSGSGVGLMRIYIHTHRHIYIYIYIANQ